MNLIAIQIDEYVTSLTSFVEDNELPEQWFETIDHIAIKYPNAEEFDSAVEEFRPMSSKITCVDMDARRLAAADLNMSFIIGKFGSVSWVEIMETRPERAGNDVVGFEHVEFYYPNFDEVQEALDAKKVVYEMQSNSGHTWINIVINARGQELKLNNRMLDDIVADELKTGVSYVI